jgi:acetylornithine deacetylase/succinyl-diaminopimelate desuccinylase-like protein
MLDVCSAAAAGWRVPPFSAEVTPGHGFPKILIARGARAAKGPLGVWLNAVEACRRVLDKPPVNLLLLAESDEILGSPHYRSMFDAYRADLSRAHACWSRGASQDAGGRAHLTLGYKGMIFATLRSSGRAWGRGPRDGPAHGMVKSVLDNPAWRLVQALASLTDRDGETVLLPGFAADPGPTTKERRPRWKRDAPILKAAEAVFAARQLEIVRWLMSGGGGPWSLFARELGIPVLRDVGLGHGQALACDEYLVIEGSGRVAGMVDMALSYVEMMLRLARMLPKA